MDSRGSTSAWRDFSITSACFLPKRCFEQLKADTSSYNCLCLGMHIWKSEEFRPEREDVLGGGSGVRKERGREVFNP